MRRRRPLRIGEHVAVFADPPALNGPTIGRIVAVADYSRGNVVCAYQEATVKTDDNERGTAVIQFHRDGVGVSTLFTRLGTPPKLKPGDEVKVMPGSHLRKDHRYRVVEVNSDESLRLESLLGIGWVGLGKTLRWPFYRKVKAQRKGLGKFRRGDLVRYDGVDETGPWAEIIARGPGGLHCDALEGEPRRFIWRKEKFKDLEVVGRDTEYAKEVFRYLFKSLGKTDDDLFVIEPSELPSNEVRIEGSNDFLDLIKGFSSESHVDKALTSLSSLIEKVVALRGDLTLKTHNVRRNGLPLGFFASLVAVPVEKVNANT